MGDYVPLPMLLTDLVDIGSDHHLYVYPARHNSLRLDLVRWSRPRWRSRPRLRLVGSITVPAVWLERIFSGEYHERWADVFAARGALEPNNEES